MYEQNKIGEEKYYVSEVQQVNLQLIYRSIFMLLHNSTGAENCIKSSRTQMLAGSSSNKS
ncbi:uncharacterized protein LOC117175242 isoform X3 [Belonocnema kinseyi]|uniref:uncharacterized protein LOC117175242 isoform X3 n=1 Tax=Belonocnema kinseyi TaxID=2817044 RepID=UPI00143CD2C5|nr:uncharacterized protein LOC117175242 isoform X3 [Belonocnema kinseyi]